MTPPVGVHGLDDVAEPLLVLLGSFDDFLRLAVTLVGHADGLGRGAGLWLKTK